MNISQNWDTLDCVDSAANAHWQHIRWRSRNGYRPNSGSDYEFRLLLVQR